VRAARLALRAGNTVLYATASLGFVEGLGSKIRALRRRAYALRDGEYLRLAGLTLMPTLTLTLMLLPL
jgi:hypothetical protein